MHPSSPFTDRLCFCGCTGQRRVMIMFRLLGTIVIPVLVFPTLNVSVSVLLMAPIGATRTLWTTRRLYRLAMRTIGRRVRT